MHLHSATEELRVSKLVAGDLMVKFGIKKFVISNDFKFEHYGC